MLKLPTISSFVEGIRFHETITDVRETKACKYIINGVMKFLLSNILYARVLLLTK
jgi:hypothetical protein